MIEINNDPRKTDGKALTAAAKRLEKNLRSTEKNISALQDAALREREMRLSAERDAASARADAQRSRRRADQLAEHMKSVHRSLFTGDISTLLLNACLNLTGAKRGLYVKTAADGSVIRVRAASGIPGYPEQPPSEFILALCAKVHCDKDSFVCNTSLCEDAPKPAGEGETWKNFIVAPVILMREFDGVIIAADKPDGDFDESDIETLLSVGDQATVAVENKHLQRELQSAYLATVSVLADAVQAKDPYTHGHCELVSRLARLTAHELRLSAQEKDLVCYAALLHDVGKIGVSDGVLNKPGELLPEEMELIRSHVRVGHDLLANVPALRSVAKVVLHHHESFDGTGYPDGLAGEAIPMASRIVSVVDAYCAMTTRRSYKDAFPVDETIGELRRCAGTQFDPRVVDAFLKATARAESQDPDDDSFASCGLLPGFRELAESRAS